MTSRYQRGLAIDTKLSKILALVDEIQTLLKEDRAPREAERRQEAVRMTGLTAGVQPVDPRPCYGTTQQLSQKEFAELQRKVESSDA